MLRVGQITAAWTKPAPDGSFARVFALPLAARYRQPCRKPTVSGLSRSTDRNFPSTGEVTAHEMLVSTVSACVHIYHRIAEGCAVAPRRCLSPLGRSIGTFVGGASRIPQQRSRIMPSIKHYN